MTTPISALGSGFYPAAAAAQTATANQPKTASSNSNSMLDPQAFLQLLVAQLKYQDPSNPTDTSTFMNQTAMLSQVQTMDSMGTTLSALADAQQAQTATNLIGKQVTYLDSHGLRQTGVVSSAELASSGATLKVGEVTVSLSDIVGVGQPATA